MRVTLFSINVFRSSCGIDLGHSFIITGGDDGNRARNTVSKYSKMGFVEDLAHLMEDRVHHACSHYKDDVGSQVLMVTGGISSSMKTLSSTEISTDLGASWKSSVPLPSATFLLRAVNLENSILLFGTLENFIRYSIHVIPGGMIGHQALDTILEYDHSAQKMVSAGEMSEKKYSFDVSLMRNVEDVCPTSRTEGRTLSI